MLEGINILVVEDNILNQKIVSFILLKHKATIKMAMNGRDAISCLQNGAFDIVLMDLQMPEMDGISAIKHIRQEMKNDIPIIALTAGLFMEEVNECERLGTNACISKPIDPEGICELIVNLTKMHKKII